MPGRARVGAYAVVPGPGFLNTTAALATAYATNAPVLCISGQIASDLIGRGFGLLHEIPDQLGILQRLTKWAARIEHPTQAGSLVNEAFRQLRSGRPRPVGLEIPLVERPRDRGALPPAEGFPAVTAPDPNRSGWGGRPPSPTRRNPFLVGSGWGCRR
jgi:acetolactate synthase-1/2/3 large subunit